MGLFDKLMNKISNVMEKGISKNLSGDSKVEYEKHKEEQQEQRKFSEEKKIETAEELALHKISASKNDLKNLGELLTKIDVLDDRKLWVGGFDNYKANLNAKTANMFSGNKNIKIISIKNNNFYFCKFDGDNFYAYKKATKADILSSKIDGLLSKKLRIQTRDGHTVSIDITENKQSLDSIKELLG